MPKIPRYTKQVELGPMPSPGAGPTATALAPEAFGAGIAKGMDVVNKLLKDEKDYADLTVFQAARSPTRRSCICIGETSN